jgi:hypothetical protein
MHSVKSRVLSFLFVASLAGLLQPAALTRTAAQAPLDDWPMFLYDVSRSSFNSNEVRLSPDNAAGLKVKWKFKVEDVLAAQPIVVGDSVYLGSWDGFL